MSKIQFCWVVHQRKTLVTLTTLKSSVPFRTTSSLFCNFLDVCMYSLQAISFMHSHKDFFIIQKFHSFYSELYLLHAIGGCIVQDSSHLANAIEEFVQKKGILRKITLKLQKCIFWYVFAKLFILVNPFQVLEKKRRNCKPFVSSEVQVVTIFSVANLH